MLIDDLYPEKGKVVLSANGKEFVERLGVETARRVILGVLCGENIRTQTEPLTRLTTAIGAATLTIRGSEKSTYGKLFERLILGSVLTILGFQHVENAQSRKLEKVFWLSDSSDVRECDATIRLRPGKLARFDIGFIGRGNPEIMKDKLTRYGSEIERNGRASFSQTFIIVDRMPKTTKTIEAAERSGSEIVQMSMQFWALDLAKKLKTRLGYESEILAVPEDKMRGYMEQKLKFVPILDFLGPTTNQVQVVKEESQPYLIDTLDDEFDEDV